MGRMWPVPVTPFRVCMYAVLKRLGAHRHHRSAHSSLHILEDSLDLGAELPRPDLASDVRDAKRLNTCAEF